MAYQPHLIGVSDSVANAIANRLLADVRAKDQMVEQQPVDTSIVGSMRNPKSQERSHRRIVRTFQPLVVSDHIMTGHVFQSVIVNIGEAKGWVMDASHRGVGVRMDIVNTRGRRHPFKAFSVKAAVMDWHLLPRFIQRAGLTDYAALLALIKAWSGMLITDSPEFSKIVDWLHDGNRRVLVPVELHGRTCAILTGSEAGIGIKHPVLRAITLLSHDMLTVDECTTIERLAKDEVPTTRLDLIKSLPQRNGHLTTD
jgi:hypothetical protein